MANAKELATRSAFRRLILVALTLLGFLGQLAIQGSALPEEMPRATIERLIGIDIAPVAQSSDCPNMAGMQMDVAAPCDNDRPMQHHSQHDGSCPLCPLLHLPAIAVTSTVFLPSLLFVWISTHYARPQAHAPPSGRITGLPPARAPPACPVCLRLLRRTTIALAALS